jgi:hypothetical protein
MVWEVGGSEPTKRLQPASTNSRARPSHVVNTKLPSCKCITKRPPPSRPTRANTRVMDAEAPRRPRKWPRKRYMGSKPLSSLSYPNRTRKLWFNPSEHHRLMTALVQLHLNSGMGGRKQLNTVPTDDQLIIQDYCGAVRGESCGRRMTAAKTNPCKGIYNSTPCNQHGLMLSAS